MNLDSYVQLTTNETELSRVRGNAYTTSSNPLVRILMFFLKIIYFLIGSIRRVVVVVTTERVIVVENQKFLWIFDSQISVNSYYPRGIIITGYAMHRAFLIFKTHYMSMSTGGSLDLFFSRDGKDRAYEIISAIKALKEKTSGV